MTKIVRVGVTFPPDLLKELDEAIDKMIQEQKGTRAGVLAMIYDHEVKSLEDTLIETQYKYSHVICSSMHVHLTERECLEAIAVNGDADEIRKLAQELTTKKGVKQVRSTIVS